MQAQRQLKVAEIKRVTGLYKLRTSQIYEVRKELPVRRLAALRKMCSLEAVLVDLQCLDLRFESRSWNSQFGSGS